MNKNFIPDSHLSRLPVKVCLISPFPPPYGGMAVQAEKLASLLSAAGCQVSRVRTNPSDYPGSGIISRIPVLRTMINMSVFLNNLRKKLRETELVYFFTGFFNFFFWVTYPALILILFSGKPVILSARGGDARRFFLKYKKRVVPVLRKVDLITTPSGFLQDAFKDVLEIETVVIPNIADLKQFEFKERSVFRPKLLVTRSLEPIYDVQAVIRAFQIVARSHPDALLGIVGKGSQRGKLEELVADLGLESKVIFYGQVSHDQIQKLYQDYDIYINASQVDNLPGVILEAFACGLPVVSTNAGGIPYMVEHGKTGLLCDVGDYRVLAENVLRILHDPDLGKSLALAGRAETSRYSWERIQPMMRNMFAECGKNMKN
ncbi:glycosyltransferase family 4 protein [Desulfonatronovibrio hydrogenovorans]|uniref:glycosyltransferase family 4 protein n=1 Tax=Desulfonatronovibrio hydrogenovorans TaxID=53245 RepID=UPI00048D28A3|nr:glycosyltransferase family 4 protein [Desulfonatronovibrio hydrogenovorans]